MQPGTFPIEGDLAESWKQPSETTYVFKLRRGVRWHNKPPVNGRELTADDVVYTYERFLTVKGNANRDMLESVDKVEAVDKYTVRFTLKEPFAWFLDVLASMATCIVAREAWRSSAISRSRRPSSAPAPGCSSATSRTWAIPSCAIPRYFVPGLPYIDGVDGGGRGPRVRMAAFLAGKYDFGPEIRHGRSGAVDWTCSSGASRTCARAESPSVLGYHHDASTRRRSSDVRVRRAMSMAINSPGDRATPSQGEGAPNPPVPAALKDWAIPIDQLGEGGQLYKHDVAARQEAAHRGGPPQRVPATLETTPTAPPSSSTRCSSSSRTCKSVGIDAKLKQKEYGAYISTTFYGKYDSMAFGPPTPFLDPDNFLYGQYYPGETKNHGASTIPSSPTCSSASGAPSDPAKRREVIFDIQQYLAKQQYYVQMPSGVYIFVVGCRRQELLAQSGLRPGGAPHRRLAGPLDLNPNQDTEPNFREEHRWTSAGR